MSELALRASTLFGVFALAGALGLAALLRSLERPRAETAAALCGGIVQLGLYALLIAAWRGTGAVGWPIPTVGFLLCALPAHALCVMAASRWGRRTLPVTTALFVLLALAVVWAERIGDRSPLLVGLAISAGLCASFGLSLVWPRVPERLATWLESPWTWMLASLSLLLVTQLFGLRVGGTVVGIRIGGVFAQPTELAFKLLLPPLVGTALVHYVRVAEAMPPPRFASRLVALAPLAIGVTAGFVVPLLLLKEHGTLVLGGLLCAGLVVLTGRGRDLALPAALAGVLVVGAALTEPRVQTRLAGLLSPACAAGHQGEQRCTAATAAASSDVLGQGIASGRARAIPQAQTDFPLSGFAEELGLPGVALLWAALAVLATFLLRDLRREPKSSALSATVHGLLAALLLQAAWNHWMNLGLFLPVMGVPFPWLSFSGTTVFASTLAAGTAALLVWQAPE
ncbi:MAG: FtsW/RodA/SpoVE family cell cycle protein [Myxococcota bacterium]|nr:FtsW/RodA/SpoVE family cell cycle protein [Myxococcota bacterium]